MAPAEKPILFHYSASIYSHRVLWYLWLRGIEYDECIQPPVMPRADLKGNEGLTVADIDAAWPFEWLIVDRRMKGSLPEEQFGEKSYPRTHAWIQRFMSEIKNARGNSANPATLDGKTMSTRVLDAISPAEAVTFDHNDPLDIRAGDMVQVYPSDYGQAHKDHGALVGLTASEVVIRNSKGLHLHFPRWNFRITKVTAKPSISPSPSSEKKIAKMRLIYHSFSPYTRKVFMLAHELNLAQHITLEKVVVAPIPIKGWSDNTDDVAVYNPMGKIPCLVTEDVPTGVFDSRVICEYLQELAGVKVKKDKRYWQMKALHACADGIMDAAVLITYEVRIRKERRLYFKEWVEGQKTKIIRGLDRFEVAIKEGILSEPGSVPAPVDEIAVAVATAMTAQMVFLGLEWQKGRPNLQEWMGKWETRGSFVKTPPTKDWDVEIKAGNVSKL